MTEPSEGAGAGEVLSESEVLRRLRRCPWGCMGLVDGLVECLVEYTGTPLPPAWENETVEHYLARAVPALLARLNDEGTP